MHMNKQELQARFDLIKAQLTESTNQPQAMHLPDGFERMTVAELNRWIDARNMNTQS